MAYNQIGKSRFYINIPEWLDSTGDTPIDPTDWKRHLLTLPVNPTSRANLTFTLKGMTANGFVAVLGHNFASSGIYKGYSIQTTSASGTALQLNNVVNSEDSAAYSKPQYNGFSISTFEGSDDVSIFNIVSEEHEESGEDNLVFGSVVIGSYFEMPHASDLSLSLSYSTGTKTIETKGGASLSNTMWRPPLWGSLGPWELNDPDNGDPTNQTLSRSGRRIWSLNFSYISESGMFPRYNALNTLAEDPNATDPSQYTLTGSDDFFSRVWNVIGSHTPCIFQPDKDVPEFAIVKIVGNSLKVTQKSHKLYDTKLKLRECW